EGSNSLHFSDPETALKDSESALLGGDVSSQTHEVIAKQINNGAGSKWRQDGAPAQKQSAMISGLILVSPEFQRRLIAARSMTQTAGVGLRERNSCPLLVAYSSVTEHSPWLERRL